jgi:hypothetical protein
MTKDKIVHAFTELYQNAMRREKDVQTADEISKMLSQLDETERLEAIREISRIVGNDYEQTSIGAREAFDWNLALLLLGRLPFR